MDKQEKLELLRDAQDKLNECIDLLEQADGDNANTQAYLIDHLKIFASNDHGFLSRDLNIDELINRAETSETCVVCDRECDSDEVEFGNRGYTCHGCWTDEDDEIR
jgi:hypothetical protein